MTIKPAVRKGLIADVPANVTEMRPQRGTRAPAGARCQLVAEARVCVAFLPNKSKYPHESDLNEYLPTTSATNLSLSFSSTITATSFSQTIPATVHLSVPS